MDDIRRQKPAAPITRADPFTSDRVLAACILIEDSRYSDLGSRYSDLGSGFSLVACSFIGAFKWAHNKLATCNAHQTKSAERGHLNGCSAVVVDFGAREQQAVGLISIRCSRSRPRPRPPPTWLAPTRPLASVGRAQWRQMRASDLERAIGHTGRICGLLGFVGGSLHSLPVGVMIRLAPSAVGL